MMSVFFFFFQAEDGIRDYKVTGVQTCALPICVVRLVELEFFFFDSIRFDQTYNAGYYFIDSEAGAWNTGKEGTPEQPNLGYKPRYKQGYFPVLPMDKFQDIRSDMVLALESVGVRIEVHHHEVATGGQTAGRMRVATAS